MTTTRAAIEQALAAGPTDGPWEQYANGAQVYGGDGFFITCVQSKKHVQDARHIAACNPTAMRQLLADHDAEKKALEDELGRVRGVLTAYADSQFCKALEMFQRPECLGWEHKAKNGQFASGEYSAHKAANEAMGAHRGIYAALALADAALSPTTTNKKEL